MPSPNATPTPITPPRVPLIDPRTGLIDRAWYMFFLSLFNAASDGGDVNPDVVSLIATYDATLRAVNQELQTLPPVVIPPTPDVLTDCCSALEAEIAEMQKQIEALELQPVASDIVAISGGGGGGGSSATAPVTVTANYTIADTDIWIINNKTATALTLTLPTASAWSGRVITVKNMQAQLVNSASSNVVPLDSTSAGTAILLAVVGNWATMVSDGTNWVIMQAASNNNLLLE